MTEEDAKKTFSKILSDLGVTRGECLDVAVNMAGVPLPDYPAALTKEAFLERQKKWCAFAYDQLLEATGPDATLLVQTFSYSYIKGEVFHLENTPSETGPFSEYFRTQPGVIRSLHPVFSVCGLGPLSSEILENVGTSAFGPISPFGKMGHHNVTFLGLGTNVGESMTYLHHMEQQYGVNYRFNKLLTTPVFKDGVEQDGPWLTNLRYLGVDCEPALNKAEAGFRQHGVLKETSYNGHPSQSVSLKHVEDIGYKMLSEKHGIFMERDIEIHINESLVADQPSKNEVIKYKVVFD